MRIRDHMFPRYPDDTNHDDTDDIDWMSDIMAAEPDNENPYYYAGIDGSLDNWLEGIFVTYPFLLDKHDCLT